MLPTLKDVCPSCGERLAPGAAPHPTVTRVVKANQLFSGKRSGERVEVEPRHLSHGSVIKATISIEEAEAAQMLQVLPPPPAGPNSRDMVRKFSEQSNQDFQREKKRRDHEAKRAAEKAAELALGTSGQR